MNKIHVLIFISIITILGLTSTFAINSIIKNNEIKREQEDIQKLSDIKSVLQEVVKEDEVNDYIDIKLSKRERIIFWLGASGELSLDDIKKNHEIMYRYLEKDLKNTIQSSSSVSVQYGSTLFLEVTSDGRYSIMETLDSEHPIIGKYTGIEMCVSW